MWQPDWPTISAVLKFTLPPCHVIGTFLELGYYARVTAPRTNRALHTLELTYQGDPWGQVVWQSSQMKTYYDSFVLCKSNHNTHITPHTVMKSRYTNVKYHCEISWYFSVHCLSESLRNYKEEAKIKPSEKALAMPGQWTEFCHQLMDWQARNNDAVFIHIDVWELCSVISND